MSVIFLMPLVSLVVINWARIVRSLHRRFVKPLGIQRESGPYGNLRIRGRYGLYLQRSGLGQWCDVRIGPLTWSRAARANDCGHIWWNKRWNT